MSNSKTIEQYFDLVNKIKVYGMEISNTKVVEKILRTILIKFGHMITTIIESHSTDTMTIVES